MAAQKLYFDRPLVLVPKKWVPVEYPVRWITGDVCSATGDMFFGTDDTLWRVQIHGGRVRLYKAADYTDERSLIHVTTPSAGLHLRGYKIAGERDLRYRWSSDEHERAKRPVMLPEIPVGNSFIWTNAYVGGPHPTGDAAGNLYMFMPRSQDLVRARRLPDGSVRLDSLARFESRDPTSMAVSADDRWIAITTHVFLLIADLATCRADRPLVWTPLCMIPRGETAMSLCAIRFAPSGDIVLSSWAPIGNGLNHLVVVHPDGRMNEVQLPFTNGIDVPNRMPVCAAGDPEGRLWFAYANKPLYVMADGVRRAESFGPANAARFPPAFRLLVGALLVVRTADSRRAAPGLFDGLRGMPRLLVQPLLRVLQRAHGVWPEQTSYVTVDGGGADEADFVRSLVFGNVSQTRALYESTESMADDLPDD